MIAHPPLAPLHEVVAALEAGGVACALGGSGLLAALGLETSVRDWDLTTDAPLAAVSAALAPWSPEWMGPNGVHADQKLMLPALHTECIVGFAFRMEAGAGVVRIPTVVASRWEDVPTGSPEAWTVAYALLGRAEKSRRLMDHLARHGADPGVIARLRAEPLPPRLDEALAALPRRQA